MVETDFQSIIKNLGIELKPAPQRVSDTADIYIVRHGLSDFNY
jgi:hypothetical protein